MTSVADSVFAKLLRLLTRLICRYPKWFIYPQIVLFVLSVIYTATQFKLDMNRDNLVGGSTHQVYMKFRAEFPGEDELAVVVQSEDMERNRQFVERLAAKLEPETNLFSDVFYKGDLTSLGKKALLFVPEPDLKEMKQKLIDFKPFLRQFTQATNLDSFFEMINQQFYHAKQEQNAQNTSLIGALPALQRIIEQASDSITRPGTPVSPGINTLFGAGAEAEERMYITFAHGKIYLVTARPRNEDVVEKAVKRMRELMIETEAEVPGLNVGLTGQPVLDFDEMQQSQKDSTMASIVSLVICSLIFIYAYRQVGRPLKAVACLIIGLGYTMAFTFLTIGHLNILTITFAPILIGLAIDFGIHLITRYEEEMRNGRTPEQAVKRAIVFTGQGIITGALTTAMAFLAMGLTDFKGIREMGIISGGGLVLCLIPMMTVLPILLMKGRQNFIDHEQGRDLEKRARIENFWLQRPVLVVIVTLISCAAAATQFRKVYFDYNLLHMQSRGLPAVVYEKKLLFSGQSVLYAAIVTDSLQEARAVEERAKTLPSVASVDGDEKSEPIFDLLTRDQTKEIQTIDSIKKEVSDLRFAPVDTGAVHVHDLSRTLWSLTGYLSLAIDTVQKNTLPPQTENSGQGSLSGEEAQKQQQQLLAQLISLRAAIEDFRVEMLKDDPAVRAKLAKFQRGLFEDIDQTFSTIKSQDTSTRLRPQDLPPALRNRFIGRTSHYMVQVFPAKDIWNHENQREFIADLKRIMAPCEDKVTGTPVQLYEYTTLLKNSYQQAALYALAAIVVMVFLHFRSFTCVILSLLPVAIGSIWTGGFMGLLGIPFNPANVMTLPLVIGIGVTNGIHILNRVAEERNPGILAKSTGKAVLVSALTALTGFGSLTLAKHQGIQSLGLVMSMGIAACMIAGLTFLPAVINLLARRGWSVAKRPSSDNARSPLGLEEPR
jgi:hopanoid biosynthesis associated RND transporter like protein HpnN